MELSDAEVSTVTVLYAFTMLAAIVGNSFLIYIVRKKPEVRSLTSSMFVNMAIADLLVALFMMPLSIVSAHTDNKWKVSGLPGDIICRSYILISDATLIASILCLVFMAIDRYCAIVCPLSVHSVWFRKAKFVTPLIWVMSISLMAIMPVVYKSDDEYCAIDPDVLGHNATFLGVNLYIFLITYLIPLAIICPLYAKAARKLWFNQAPGNHLIEEQQSRQLVTRRKVVRMLVIIVVVFAICWLPAQALHLFWAAAPYSDHLPAIVMYLGFWVAHANSAINPWLYIALSTKIRLAFNRMVTFRKSHPAFRNSTERRSNSTKATTFRESRV
ncbi:tachykinin-like peptides receptor 86C [Porites lutea]|uniref:tachykinin-like peptides receptor 86C n=1 Tax=Porites lutea TaxID=51062 RepID=UPI003CC55C23